MMMTNDEEEDANADNDNEDADPPQPPPNWCHLVSELGAYALV